MWRTSLIVLLLASPAQAGRLDLNIFTPVAVVREPSQNAYRLQFEWKPGDPRGLRGETPFVRSLAHGGYATIGAFGLAESLRGGDATAAAGFGAVTALQGWMLFREKSWKPKELEVLGIPVTK
jgi:hypothetical protein